MVWCLVGIAIVEHDVLWSAGYIGRGMALSSLGIVLDILGACTLVWSSLRKHLASLPFAYKAQKQDGALPSWRRSHRWMLEASRVLGPRDPVAATDPSILMETRDLAIGLWVERSGSSRRYSSAWRSC